ncbi:hypothetical protein DFH09DRAFT_286107 [Mycena vulgaris]|nr:hypothetical protein DFH09DRAFT_286107 [Mycena vulgaris]
MGRWSLPPILYLRAYFTVHRSSDCVFVLSVHMVKYNLLTPKPPPSPRPVTRVLHPEHVASEHQAPLHQIPSRIEFLRATLVFHAHTALSPIHTHFPFCTYTTYSGPFDLFLLHPCPPYLGLPTYYSVYRQRTRYCDNGERTRRTLFTVAMEYILLSARAVRGTECDGE